MCGSVCFVAENRFHGSSILWLVVAKGFSSGE
jgi:hypothetical protein